MAKMSASGDRTVWIESTDVAEVECRTKEKIGLTQNFLTIVVSTHMGALPYVSRA